jgi:hypothetical protein
VERAGKNDAILICEVLESRRDDATGLVTIQTDTPAASGPTSIGSSATASGSTVPENRSTGQGETVSTGGAARATGAVRREVLFGAAGAVGAGIFGL